MHLTEQWIEAAIRIQHLQMERLPASAAQATLAAIRSRYGIASAHAWAQSLAADATALSSAGLPLSALFPATVKTLFIPAAADAGGPPIFISSIAQIDRVLASCPPFPYYVVALDHSWGLIATSRGEYLLCGSLPLDGVLTG